MTYIIAPDAKLNRYGNIGTKKFANSMVIIAPIGSTMPDNIPYRNDLGLVMPSALSGMDIIAPSGKFCMAIPMDSTIAFMSVMLELPVRYPAKTIPTAIPSGRLCNVTANTNIVVFFRWLFTPSDCVLFTCRCGIITSKTNKNPMPNRNPMVVGRNANFPKCADCSIDGIIKLQIDAAIITPDANPVSDFCNIWFSVFFIKNTHDAPNDVPKNGINNP